MKMSNMRNLCLILLGNTVYALAIVVLKIFTKDEFKMMPAGDKIVKFLEKLKIY